MVSSDSEGSDVECDAPFGVILPYQLEPYTARRPERVVEGEVPVVADVVRVSKQQTTSWQSVPVALHVSVPVVVPVPVPVPVAVPVALRVSLWLCLWLTTRPTSDSVRLSLIRLSVTESESWFWLARFPLFVPRESLAFQCSLKSNGPRRAHPSLSGSAWLQLPTFAAYRFQLETQTRRWWQLQHCRIPQPHTPPYHITLVRMEMSKQKLPHHDITSFHCALFCVWPITR